MYPPELVRATVRVTGYEIVWEIVEFPERCGARVIKSMPYMLVADNSRYEFRIRLYNNCLQKAPDKQCLDLVIAYRHPFTSWEERLKTGPPRVKLGWSAAIISPNTGDLVNRVFSPSTLVLDGSKATRGNNRKNEYLKLFLKREGEQIFLHYNFMKMASIYDDMATHTQALIDANNAIKVVINVGIILEDEQLRIEAGPELGRVENRWYQNAKTLQENMDKLRESAADVVDSRSDVRLTTRNGDAIGAHAVVLATRSTWFRQRLSDRFDANTSAPTSIALPLSDGDAAVDLLKLVYSGVLPPTTRFERLPDAIELLFTGTVFEFPALRERSENALEKFVESKRAKQLRLLFDFSENFQCAHLKSRVIKYLVGSKGARKELCKALHEEGCACMESEECCTICATMEDVIVEAAGLE